MTGPPGDAARPPLDRRLGTTDAVAIGLASMMGAGVFAVFGPAARVAGAGLLAGLGVAALVAFCNATASAQLAAAYPVSGGTYHYGGQVLGPWWGFLAGWGFVVGKTASCAAMALTVASYLLPGHGPLTRLVAAVAVVACAGLNLRGVTRTALAARVIAAVTLAVLAVSISTVLVIGNPDSSRLGWHGDVSVYGVLQSAGLMFFAFAGYARMATLGEEVRDPARTLPRAIPLALLVAVAVYAVVAISALLVSGPARLATSLAPLVTVVRDAGAAPLVPVLVGGAALASIGSLLALMAGIGRTGLAMARNRDLPGWLDAVHPRTRVPHRVELAVTVVVVVVVLTADLRQALGFSSFGVLIYYAVANLSAWRQPSSARRWPRALNVVGLVGCLTLVATLPWPAVLVGVAVFAVGALGRYVVVARRGSSRTDPR